MVSCIEPYSNLKRLFSQKQKRCNETLYNALFNPDPYYDMLRKDIDECCEIAFRYNLIVNEERGLLKGGRNIYEYSFLNEFRVARLFEKYFGKGCLNWDPPGKGARVGEFLFNIDNPDHAKYSIFVEVKTRTEQRTTKLGTLDSHEYSIENLLKKAYRKAPNDWSMPFLVILCHDHFKINIDEYQVIKSCFGTIVFQEGSPKVVSPGFCSKHKLLSAIGLYYFYVNPGNKEFQEFFEVFHNHYANIQIDKSIFVKKADKQFYLPEWNGKFTDV